MRKSAASLLLAAGLLGAAPPLAGAGDDDPTDPGSAVRVARPLLEAAKLVKPSTSTKEGKDASAGVLQAYAYLKPNQKEGLKLEDFRNAWNELITLGRFHGLKAVPTEYLVEKKEVDGVPLNFALPVGRGWAYRAVSDRDAQQRGEITKTLANERIVRHIRISVFYWNMVYVFDDGVKMPGENEKGIAEEWLKRERKAATSIKSRSNEVSKGRLGKGMPKAYTYEVVGTDKEIGPVRRRIYMTKGSLQVTYAFEVVETRKPGIQDDPWTEYLTLGEPDYELEAVLDSFVDRLAGK